MSQEIITEFGRMNRLLNKMEAERVVDLAILGNITFLRNSFERLESDMVNEKSADVKSRFLSYHIFRNISLILTKMEQRFKIAKEIHDNPVVADNSLAILTTLTHAANIGFKYGGKKLTQKEEDEMLYCIQTLRDNAHNASMLIKAEDEAKAISRDALSDEGKIIADSIDQTYFKEKSFH